MTPAVEVEQMAIAGNTGDSRASIAVAEEALCDAILRGENPYADVVKEAAGYGRSKYKLQVPKTELVVRWETNEELSEKSSEPAMEPLTAPEAESVDGTQGEESA